MKRIIRVAALLLSIAMLTGCAHNTIHAHILTGDKITPLDVTAEAAGDFSPVGDLGAKLLNSAVQSGEQNPVISPLSAYICLAASRHRYNGCSPWTANIEAALRILLPEQQPVRHQNNRPVSTVQLWLRTAQAAHTPAGFVPFYRSLVRCSRWSVTHCPPRVVRISQPASDSGYRPHRYFRNA